MAVKSMDTCRMILEYFSDIGSRLTKTNKTIHYVLKTMRFWECSKLNNGRRVFLDDL